MNLYDESKAIIIDIFSKFFDDTDSEIRNMCCIKLDNICETLGAENDVFEKVLEQLKKVENDNIVAIRGINYE